MKKNEKKYERFNNYIIYFMLYAIIGWIYEVLLELLVWHHGFVNRGTLFGPWLPVYGFGGLLLAITLNKLLKKKKKNLIEWIINILTVFIAVFIITTVVEYITHYVLDTYFNIKLWDYSKDFLNINGRVCFNASRNFAVGGTILLYLTGLFLIKSLGTSISSNFFAKLFSIAKVASD